MKKVVVSELKEDTFYAVIWLEREGKLISVDSRPSDALALALRHDCPILCGRAGAANRRETRPTFPTKSTTKSCARWLENLNDEDLGRYKM